MGSMGSSILGAGEGAFGAMTGNPQMLMMGGSQLLGGLTQDRAANQQAAASQARYQQMMGMGQGLMQTQPNQWETGLSQLAQHYQMPGQYQAGQFNPSQFNMGSLGINNITQGAGVNTSQDALMQMLNRNPADQLGQAGQTLSQLAQTGAPANAQSLISALQPMQQQQMNTQVNQLRAGASGLGARYGSGMGANEALLRSNLGAQQNASNAGLVYQGQQDAANRMLQAGQSLGGLLNQGYGTQLGAASGLNQLAGTQLQGAGLGLQGGLANMGALNQGGMFNVQSGMQGQQINNQMQQFGQNYLAGLYGQGGQLQNQQSQLNNQLFSAMNGIQGPQFNAYGANTLGSVGQMMLDPTMLRILGNIGQPGNGPVPQGTHP